MKLTFIVFWIAFLGFNTTSIAQPQPLDLVSQAIGAIQDNFYDTAYGKVSDWERLKFEIFNSSLLVNGIFDCGIFIPRTLFGRKYGKRQGSLFRFLCHLPFR